MAGNLYDDAVEQLADSTPAPTLPPNPYDQTVQDMHAGQTQTLRTSLAQADGTTPDRAADVAKLSQRTGVPAPIIDRNYDTIRRRATLDDTPYRQMLTDSPATSAFLAEPSQAAVAADDHGALGALEWLAKLPGHVFAQSFAENKFGALSAKRILGPLTPDEYDQLDAARYYAGEGARLGAGDSWFRNFLTKGMQTAAALLVPEALPTVLGGAVGAVIGGGAAALAGPEAIIPGALAGARYGAGVGYTAGLAGSAFLSGAGSAYDRYLSQTDELGRPMDPDVAKGAALVEGAINAGLMVVGGKIIGKTIEIGGTKLFAKDAIAAALRQPTVRAALGDLVKTYGATLTEGTALNVAMKAGELLVDAGARHAKPGTVPGQTAPGNIDLFQQPKVTNADGSVSTVDSASANIDGQEVLLSRVTPDGRHLSTDEAIAEYQRTGKHLGTFDSPASADAFAQKLHQDYAAGRYDRPSVVSQLGQAALEGLQSFALVGAVGPALGFVGDLARAKQAAAGPALFNALAEGVTQSKTAQRLPDAAQTFLANAMKDGPVETVYAPIEAWTSYWQSQGVDPAKMATTLTGNADAYAQATRTGEDLAIPTAAYAMKLAATEHNAFFQNELRIGDPAAMNAREAAAFVKQSGQVDEKLNSAPEPAAAVRENILGQLEAAGVERHTAESYATLYEHTFQTLGARAGVDPVELFNRYGLTIGRPDLAPTGAGETQLNQQPLPEFVPIGGEAAENADRQAQQDAQAAGQPPIEQIAQTGEADPRKAILRAAIRGQVRVEPTPQTDTDAFKAWFGESKMVDDQGAPRVLYHGTDKSFDTFDVEHAGAGRGSKEERALFFSQTPDTANASAEVMGAGSGGDVVYPVYVKLENPYVSAMKFYNSREMEQEISRAKAEGHDGITFPQLTTPGEADTVAVFSPEQVKSAIGNRGTFDQTDANILHQSEPTKIVRGSISFGADRQFNIELLKHADLTTFLHESGHFFLEVLHDLAQQPDANPGIRADLATLDDWFADEDHTGPRYSVKQHEQFARGFEAYLMEGKAPSAELRPVFARFRAWLVGVYRSLTSLHVQLTDPVREVMDRLVASDDAISQAEAEGHIDPLFTNAAMAGMTPEGFNAYRATVQAASDSAKTELQIKLLRDVQREQQAWWKRERETLRAQVATEMGEQPAYRALTAMQNGTRPDGTPLVDGQEPTPLKLAKADLVDRYTPEEMKALRNRRLYAVDGGVHPDVVAQLVGFSSGDDLVRTLLRTPSMKAAIDGETDARMRATHGDLVLDGRLPEAAQAAVYGEGRQQVIQAELRALTAGMVKGTIPPADVINAAAQQRIADTRIRDVRPGQFLMAARRASQRAFDLLATHADRAGAVQAKQQELINLALYREATKAKEAVDSAVTYLRSFDTTATRARIGKAGADYLEQIDGLRARFDLSRQTLTAVDRRQSLAKWAAAKETSTGLPLELPEELLNEARRGHYTDLTVNELQGVRDGVEMIAHLATLKNKLLKLQAGRELAEATGAAVTSIAEHSTGKREAGIETRLPGSQGSKNIATFFASHRKLSSFLRQMDGFQDGGTMWDGIMRPLNEAADAEAVRNEQATIALRRLFEDAYKGEETTLYRKTSIPAIGDSLTKMGQLMVALNWGNDGNRQRIRDGYHWTDDQVRAVLDGLDARDWTFVQGVWDHINSYWSDIAAKERRVTGIAPEKVAATPVATKFGEMPGGYFPLKYDHEQSARAAANLEAGFADGVKQASYVRATTQRGHTEARVAKVSEPVRLDFGVITEHVQQVIHDLTHHETLIDVGRILGHRDVQDAIYEHYGPIVYDQLKGAVRDIAFGNTPAPGWYQTLNAIRAKTVTATLGWNAVTSLLHTLQLTRGMVRVGPGYVTHGLVRWLSSAKNADYSVGWIESQSDMMRLRWKTQQRELNEVRNTVGLDRGTVSAAIHDTLAKVGVDPGAMPAIADSYFYAIRRIVQFAEIPTWIGAYEKAMADAATTPDRAVALANQAVEDSMGSGHIKDLSAVQRAPMARLLTTFYDYHNAVYQQAYELVKNSDSPGRKLVDASLLLFAPVAFSAAVYHALAPAPAHPQAATAAETAKEIAGEGADYGLNMFVGLRELSGAFTGRDYEGPAGLKFIPTTRNLIYRAAQEFSADGRLTPAEKAANLAKAGNEFGGTLFGYPARQVEKTASGVQALWTGKTSKPSALLFGAPAGPK